MNAEQLSRVGEKLVKRCGSRDPFEIARQLGINVMLCENFGSLKGMYRVIKRNRFIFLNNSLDENIPYTRINSRISAKSNDFSFVQSEYFLC